MKEASLKRPHPYNSVYMTLENYLVENSSVVARTNVYMREGFTAKGPIGDIFGVMELLCILLW